jgi:hypothetical protein
MTTNGKQYLNKMKKHFSLPLVSKLSSFKNKEIQLDIRAAIIYTSIYPHGSKHELLNLEFKQNPLYIK